MEQVTAEGAQVCWARAGARVDSTSETSCLVLIYQVLLSSGQSSNPPCSCPWSTGRAGGEQPECSTLDPFSAGTGHQQPPYH